MDECVVYFALPDNVVLSLLANHGKWVFLVTVVVGCSILVGTKEVFKWVA